MKIEEMKVLVVEDNPADARFIKAILTRNGVGFRLLHEPSLESAMQQLSEEEMDAILLDLSLPGSVGLETITKIHEADSLTPIVVLTGCYDENSALEALRLGAQDYLVKDRLDGELLVKTLRYSVERHRRDLLEKLEPMENDLRRSLNALTRLSTEEGAGKSPWLKKNIDGSGSFHDDPLDLMDLMKAERVTAHFQPWVSLKKRGVVGFEGLCRGLGEKKGVLISPVTLLKLAGKRRLLNDLDHLFRKKVLESFEQASRWNPDLLLSVNFDTSILNQDEAGLDDFLGLVQEHGLDPGHVAIEILESHHCDLDHLKRFIDNQRRLGFLIALDDIGVGYSNLDRIAMLEPDLIKTDRTLIKEIDQSYHQQEVFKSMVKLAHRIGALVVAEGAETEREAIRALELGADMIQGFYFSEPREMSEELLSCCEEKIDDVAKKFKSCLIQNINTKKSHYRDYDQMVSRMTWELSVVTPKSFDQQLTSMLVRFPKADCLFILDEAGAQMSQMVRAHSDSPRDKTLFKASPRGTDHSLKDYYYSLVESDLKNYTFVTDPYLSLATGKLCITISTLFKDAYGRPHVLCVDINPKYLPG